MRKCDNQKNPECQNAKLRNTKICEFEMPDCENPRMLDSENAEMRKFGNAKIRTSENAKMRACKVEILGNAKTSLLPADIDREIRSRFNILLKEAGHA